MNQISKAAAFTNDIQREIDELRRLAAEPHGGVRVLQELELGWVAGGDAIVVWPTAPSP